MTASDPLLSPHADLAGASIKIRLVGDGELE
jgi:hypothetical protein